MKSNSQNGPLYPPVEPLPMPHSFLDEAYSLASHPPFKANTPTPFALLASTFDLVAQQKGPNS